MKAKVKVLKLSHFHGSDSVGDLMLPFYATDGSAGMDLSAAIIEPVLLKPLERKLIPTGICIELENGFEATVRPRSGLALKNGITVLNTPGTIDSDYMGEICVILVNLGSEDFLVERGMRIAQIIFSKYEKIDLEEVKEFHSYTSRGSSGFGSTGVKNNK